MRLSETLRLVWVNITGNKFKVMLTSLGIIVGAATIVMVIAIGRGGQADVADQFKNLSAGAIDISYSSSGGGGMMMAMTMAMPSGGGGGGGRGGAMRPATLSPFGPKNIVLGKSDMEDLTLFVPNISAASLSATTKKGVTGGNLEEETQYTIAGVTEGYSQVSNLELAAGEFITEENEANSDKVAVIGYNLAVEVFGSPIAAYDSVIYIDKRAFTIGGVLSKMGTVTSGISPDDSIFIPFSSAKKYVMGRDMSPQITVVADDVTDVPKVMENIKTVLEQSYDGANFSVTDAGSKMEAAAASANTLSMLLIAVASIVFIVGGIGIMNVLFVSVQERTREIGILKALGCGKRDILIEFLAEANMISTFGGVVGVLLATALMPLMQYTGIRVEPSAAGIVLALIFAVFTGTVFGFYPAKKAASLVPIEALNME
ncbi:MAG: ABC transporter permease [Angelakisella sp.]